MADSFAGGRGGENASDLPSCQGRKQKSTTKKRRNMNVGEHLFKATEDLIRPAGTLSGVCTHGKIICVIRNIKSGPTGHLATCAPTLAQPRGYGARIANQDYLQGGCPHSARLPHRSLIFMSNIVQNIDSFSSSSHLPPSKIAGTRTSSHRKASSTKRC